MSRENPNPLPVSPKLQNPSSRNNQNNTPNVVNSSNPTEKKPLITRRKKKIGALTPLVLTPPPDEAIAAPSAMISELFSEPLSLKLITQLIETGMLKCAGTGYTISFNARKIIFRKIEDLGEGQFGHVSSYHVSEEGSPDTAFIIAGKELIGEPADKRSEFKKTKIIQQMKIPGLIDIHACTTEPSYLIFMEHSAQTLIAYLKEHNVAQNTNNTSVMQKLLDEVIQPLLDVIHNLNYNLTIFHLDIKVANVLLRAKKSEGTDTAIICDFGTFRTQEKINEKGLTGVGTFELNSPERFGNTNAQDMSRDDISKVTDSWALGLLIKKMLGLKTSSPEQDLEDSVFGREENFSEWSTHYSSIFTQYLIEQQENLTNFCDIAKTLNAIANCLLAPMSQRISVKDLLTPTGAVNLSVNWQERADQLASSISTQEKPPVLSQSNLFGKLSLSTTTDTEKRSTMPTVLRS